MKNLPSKSLPSLKTAAKKLSKDKGIAHSEALDLVAMQEGFNSWSLLAKQFSDYVINSFDMLCKEILNGRTTLLAAGPWVGKTTLAINILLKALESGQSVCYLSSNLSESEIRKKLLAIHTSLPQVEFEHYPHELSANTIRDIAKSIEFFDSKNVRVESLNKLLASEVAARIERNNNDNTLYIIDYVQAVQLDTNAIQTYDEFVMRLKSANKGATSVLLLNQIDDEDAYNNGNKVVVKNIVGGDDLVRHCDFVLGLNRQSSAKNDTELCILKSFFNAVPAIKAKFNPDVGLFSW